MQLMRFGFPLVLALALGAGAATPAAAQSVTTSRRAAPAGQHLRRLASGRTAPLARRQRRVADAGRARRCGRRGHLPESEAAEERDDLAPRLHRGARPRRQHPQSRARRFERRQHPPAGSVDDRPVSTAGSPERAPSISRPSDPPVRSQNPNEIPVATEFDVRLQNPLSSKTVTGRGSLRGDDHGGSARRARPRDGARRLGDARRRELGEPARRARIAKAR